MTPDLCTTYRDLDPYALAVLRDLCAYGDQHFEHRPMSTDPDARVPSWVLESVAHIRTVQAGTFVKETKLPASWVQAHYPRPETLLAWDEVRSMLMRSLVAMLSDPTYRKGSKFHPEQVPDWFLCTPNRKPRWSCFLRYAGMPDVRGPLTTDLKGTCLDPVLDSPTLRIQRVRNSMTPEAVEAVEKALGRPGAKSYGAVGWERAGRLYGWFQGARKYRDQFGDQLDRPEGVRHSARWDKALGSFGGLVRLCMGWPEGGPWGGWFPIPGEPTWETFADWIAREYGVWIVEQGEPEGSREKREPVVRGEWERAFVLDP